MQSLNNFPASFERLVGKTAMITANAGKARRIRISEALCSYAEVEQFWVTCNAPREGLWSGVNQLLKSVISEIESEDISLVERHRRELAVVIPELRNPEAAELGSLTDLATPSERVRNYAVDRIYRILHGLIDFVSEWREKKQNRPWILVCEGIDEAGVLATRFFIELKRRAGNRTSLFLVLAAEPSVTAPVTPGYDRVDADFLISWDLPKSPEPIVSPAEADRCAEELESKVGQSSLLIEKHVSELIFYWKRSSRPERALRWQAAALGLYNHMGCYEDAVQFIAPVLSNLDSICKEENGSGFWRMTRWNIVGNIYGCYNSVNRPDLACAVVTEALGKLQEPSELARACYVLAMSHARFLPQRDNDKAETLLLEGLQLLESAAGESRPFLTSFLMNGLAYVRHRQGRHAEAIDLCSKAYDHLSRHLDGNIHRLHRSVLFYNTAQVYAATGSFEKAIEHYSAAIEMDPNYSEYYNERGNIFLGTGRLAEAEKDYLTALRLSSPYYEVWANLGQCYSLMERLEEAIVAYGVAIDLNPSHSLALIGRAQALQRQNHLEEALRDYTSYLLLNRDQSMVLSNRAAVYWKLGRIEDALADLTNAVELDPSNKVLHQNLKYFSRFSSAVPTSATM